MNCKQDFYLIALLITSAHANGTEIETPNYADECPVTEIKAHASNHSDYSRKTPDCIAVGETGDKHPWYAKVSKNTKALNATGSQRALRGELYRRVMCLYIKQKVSSEDSKSWMKTTDKVRKSMYAITTYARGLVTGDYGEQSNNLVLLDEPVYSAIISTFSNACKNLRSSEWNAVVLLNWMVYNTEVDTNCLTDVREIGEKIKSIINTNKFDKQIDAAVRDVEIYVNQLGLAQFVKAHNEIESTQSTDRNNVVAPWTTKHVKEDNTVEYTTQLPDGGGTETFTRSESNVCATSDLSDNMGDMPLNISDDLSESPIPRNIGNNTKTLSYLDVDTVDLLETDIINIDDSDTNRNDHENERSPEKPNAEHVSEEQLKEAGKDAAADLIAMIDMLGGNDLYETQLHRVKSDRGQIKRSVRLSRNRAISKLNKAKESLTNQHIA